MAVIELHPNRLPLEPPAYTLWNGRWPEYSRAYNRTLHAESHAAKQAQVNLNNRGARDDVRFARVAGYLLIELFKWRKTLGTKPCETVLKALLSEVREPAENKHDVVFSVGRWYHDHLIHLCTLGFFPSFLSFSDPLQSSPLPRGTPNPTCRSCPFPPARRRVRPRST